MASRGQWKVTKEYPKIKIADEYKSYRITANDENKKHINVIYRKTVHVRDIKTELELSNSKKIGETINLYATVEYTDTLNPGCSLDIEGRMVKLS